MIIDNAANDATATARMRRVAVVTAVAAIAPLSIIGVVLTADTWWEGLTFAVGLLLPLGVLREWSLDGYPRRAIFALAFTGVAWGIGAVTTSSPVGFVPFSLVGALLVARTTHRMLWTAALALSAAAIGAGSFLSHSFTVQLVAAYIALPLGGTLFIAAIIRVSEQAWLVVRRLERAQEAESELAVARERVRFAGDLHDLQGHSLHVIKLKAALARRLLRDQPDRAEAELDEIRGLADTAIAETRSLAYAPRELNLAAEVQNAKRLGEAAGIGVEVRLDPAPGTAPHPLLAQVLREATTNLLRHARPRTVTIIASPVAVEVSNDGVTHDGSSPLRGLALLRERVRDVGGTLDIQRPPGRFVVTARIDAADARSGDREPT